MKSIKSALGATCLMIMTIVLVACGGGAPDGGTTGSGGSSGGGAIPTASAVTVQRTTTGFLVNLDGSGSSDPGGAPLTYSWSITSKPAGSFSLLTSNSGATTSLTPDIKGTYTVSLTVDNGSSSSIPLAINVYSSPAGMTYIPDGCFNMGDGDGVGDADELPVHNVCITGFHMDVHEMTNSEFSANCILANINAGTQVCTGPLLNFSNTRNPYYTHSSFVNYPVIYVNHADATTVCEGVGKRLPTEAEWEYAARGGLDGKTYPWGDAVRPLTLDANVNGTDTVQVESYLANGYGLFDMAGNVAEWTRDWHDSNYYGSSPTNDPQGGTPDPLRFGRVTRGGAFNAFNIRVADREYADPVTHHNNTGFRCVEDN